MFLAGDAAHLNSPSGGMGMNGGIHDAFDLCEKIIAIEQEGPIQENLDRYERQRRPIAEEEIIQQAHRNRSRMQERDPCGGARRSRACSARLAIRPAQGLSAEIVVHDRRAAAGRRDGMRYALLA